MKIRRNHNTSKSGPFGGGARILIMAVVILAFLFWGGNSLISWMQTAEALEKTSNAEEVPALLENQEFENTRWLIEYLPTSNKGQIVKHQHFDLSYSEEDEQAEWVCYLLSKASLKKPNVPRTDWFEKDLEVTTGSMEHKDYSGSGYTRGHLAPAGDLAYSEEAMKESFLMSNISPQLKAFNNGVWKELEEQTRDWAWKEELVIVVSGPILSSGLKKVKKSKLSIPEYFFKIVFDVHGDDKKAIAFIIPNALSTERLQTYAVPIDEVEIQSGIDFFPFLSETEEKLFESTIDLNQWEFSESRFRQRIEEWNYN